MKKKHYGSSSVPLNNKEVQIVPMGFADIEVVSKIEALAHSHPWSEKLFLSNFGRRYFNHLIMFSDQPVGYFVASSVAGEVTLMNIAIAPDKQGNGLGAVLLQFLIGYAKANNELEIWLEVRVSNKRAIALYQKLGFVEVDKRKDYYPLENGREDALVMCCYLA